jgi:hypothetical protein
MNDVVFTCVGTLAILDRLEEVDAQMLAWWLAERQLPSGGLNGRPQKLEDVSGDVVKSGRVDNYLNVLGLLQFLGALRALYLEEALLDRCRPTYGVYSLFSGH